MPLTDSLRDEQSLSTTYSSWLSHVNTEGEEWINGLTHAVGCVLGIMGSVMLLWSALDNGLTWCLAACIVYCASLVGVYTASTLSHWVRDPVWRHRCRSWDQGLIFILIVATFTPFSVAYLSGWWYCLTALLWLLGITGFVSKVAHAHCVDNIVLWLYLILGWLPIVALPSLWAVAPAAALLVLVGGIVYSMGSVLLSVDRRPYLHAGWHLSVIVASAIHFVAVYRYVVPLG